MSCDRVRDLLSLYIDEQLPAEQRRQVEEHMAACPECAAELALLRQAVQLAASLDELELPTGFHAGVQERLSAVAAAEVGGLASAETASVPGSAAGNARTAGRRATIVAPGDGFFSRARAAMRRPVWRGALATAAAVVILFTVASQLLPGWNGNVWSLFTTDRQVLTGAGKPSDTAGTDTTKNPSLSEGSQPSGMGGTDTVTPGRGTSVIATDVDITATTNLTDAGTYVIRTGTLTVEVRSFNEAEPRVAMIVDTAGGYVEQSSLSLDGTVKSGWFRVRVPQDKFSAVMVEFEKLGTLRQKQIGSEDVSTAIVDLEARIANLRRQELRLGELLSQAKTLDEVLRVENELNRVRYEIESYDGQLKWLRNRATMATVQLTLREPDGSTPDVPGADIWRQIWKAFVATWRAIGRFLIGLVVFVASVAPVVLILLTLWWAYRRSRYGAPRPAPRAPKAPPTEDEQP